MAPLNHSVARMILEGTFVSNPFNPSIYGVTQQLHNQSVPGFNELFVVWVLMNKNGMQKHYRVILMHLSMCRPTTLLGRGQANMEDLTIIIPQVKFPTYTGEDSLFKYPNSPVTTSHSLKQLYSLYYARPGQIISVWGQHFKSNSPYVRGSTLGA